MADIPAPPPGFQLTPPTSAGPAPPPGFELATPPVTSLHAPYEQAAPSVGAPPPGTMEPTAKAAKPAEPSVWDRIVDGARTVDRYAGQIATGARKGITGLVGLPVDAAALVTNGGIWAANKGLDAVGYGDSPRTLSDLITDKEPAKGPRIPYVTEPVGGGAWLDKLATAPNRVAGFNDPAPQSAGERIINRIGEEVGATAVPVGAGLTLAKRGVEAARELPALARMFAEPAAINPAKFVSREGQAAVAAGTGAGLMNEATGAGAAKAKGEHLSGWQTAGDIGGAVGGVGLAAAGKTIGGVTKNLYGALKGNTSTSNQVIRDVAVDEIARASGLEPGKNGVTNTDPLADAVNRGTKISDTIPGFQESLADRTKNPGLAAMEYSRQTGPNSGKYAAARTANTEAVDAAMKPIEPQATPGAFSGELAAVRDRRLNDAATARAAAEDEAARATSTLQPQGTPEARGNTIRTELDAAREAARENTAQAYNAADVGNNVVAPGGLAEALDAVDGGLTQVERTLVPRAKIDAVRRLGEPPEPVNTGLLDFEGRPIVRQEQTPDVQLREATSLRTELQRLRTNALADPRAENGGRDAARVLGQYLDAVEGFIQRSSSPEQRAALQAARDARYAEGEAFGRRGDPVADILSAQPGGRYRMRDENVADRATNDAAMARILEEADTPATRTAIRNQLLSNADTATAAGLHDFQQRYAQQIARFPGLNDELGAAVRARVSENTARGAEGGLQSDIGREGKGVVAKYLQYGDENAQKAMQGVLASKDPAKAADELLSFVGDDPKAVEGARKVFWDILQKKTRSDGSTTATINNTQPYLPAALKRFTEDPATATVAERLYRDNPEHWQRIKEITQAMQGVNVRNTAKAPNTSGTPQALQGGYLPSGETIASRVFAVERGVVSPAFAAINIAGIIARKAMKAANKAGVDAAIDKALLDPDFAALLLKENNPANRAAMRRATKGWQANEASTILQALEPDDKDANTKDAAMRGAK